MTKGESFQKIRTKHTGGVGRLRINAVNKKFNQAVEAYYKTPIGKIDKLLAKVKKGKTLVDKAKDFINKNWSMVTFYD